MPSADQESVLEHASQFIVSRRELSGSMGPSVAWLAGR